MWKRTIAPVVVVSVFWFLVGGATSYYLNLQSQVLDLVLAENISSIRTSIEMQETVRRIHAVVLQAARDQTTIPAEPLRELELSFNRSLQVASQVAKLPAERKLVDDLNSRFQRYISKLRDDDFQTPDLVVATDLLPQVTQITTSCHEIRQFNENLIRELSNRRQRLTKWIVFGRGAMLVIGPGMGLLMGFRLAGQLRRSITSINVSLQSVAGDLEQEIGRLEITPQGDLPEIQQQLNVIADRIRGVVQELHQARRETIRADRLAAVGELAAGVAHEIRNPLTSVKLLIQTMQHRLPPNTSRETFDVVLEEINRMETTIQGMLDFARPPKLQRALQDLRSIVKRAVNLTEGKARQSGVRVLTSFPEEPVRVDVDAELMHQVCINLLLNGIESSVEPGTLHVQIITDEHASVVRVLFEDTGAGIPADILPRLFEPFVTSKDHGTGLGLAISRRIVLSHFGKLLAENRPDGGTVLTIELPLHLDPAEPVKPHAHLAADR